MKRLDSDLIQSTFEKTIDLDGIGICLCKNNGTIIYMNQKAIELIGLDNDFNVFEEIIEENITKLNKEYKELLSRIKKEGEINNIEYYVNNEKWLLFHGCKFNKSKDKDFKILITTQDISLHKKTECRLKKSESKLNSIISTIPDIVYRLNANGEIIFISDIVQDYGYNPKELIGTHILDLVHPEDRDKANYKLNERRTGERKTRSVDMRMVMKNQREDHDYSEFQISSEGIYKENGDENKIFIGSQGIARDISKWRNVEYELRINEERAIAVLNSLEDGYYEADLKGMLTYINNAFCNLTGYKQEEIIGKEFSFLFKQETVEDVMKLFTSVYETNKPERLIDWEILRKDHKKRLAEGSISLIKDQDNEFVGFRGIVRDITKKKKIENELLQARKLEAVGILAGGIAHDYNNALTAILGNLSLAKMDINPDEKELIEILNDAEKASMKVLELTKRLSTFAKGGRPNLRPTPSDMTKQFIEEKVEDIFIDFKGKYNLEIESNLLDIEIDVIQMGNVIGHILKNAIESTDDNGQINATVENTVVEEEKSHHEITLQPDKYVKISISDNGTGILDENINNIFDPYFTTKSMASGMGLAISYAVIKRHHGYIDVVTKEGKGTTFIIYLPVKK